MSTYVNLLYNYAKAVMFESFSFRPSTVSHTRWQVTPYCHLVWDTIDCYLLNAHICYVDCSFSLALCTENKCFTTLYYVLVGFENLGIRLSDTSKSMVKGKPKGCPLIIKLLLSIWLLVRIIYNYYYHIHPNRHFHPHKRHPPPLKKITLHISTYPLLYGSNLNFVCLFIHVTV